MKSKWLPRIIAAFFGGCAALLALYPETSADAAIRACGLWAAKVMPALFPYLVVSQLIAACLSGDLFLIPLSMLGGSPAGARLVSLSHADGQKAQRLCALCSTVSPLYIIGTLQGGYRMLAAHWLGAFVAWGAVWVWQRAMQVRRERLTTDELRSTTACLRTANMPREKKEAGPTIIASPIAISTQQCLEATLADSPKKPTLDIPKAIADSVLAILSVCGCMVLFSVLWALAMRVVPLSAFSSAALLSVLEMAGGCDRVLSLGMPMHQATPILCAVLSFGGLSIFLQNATFLKRKNVNLRVQLLAKTIHALAAYLICGMII